MRMPRTRTLFATAAVAAATATAGLVIASTAFAGTTATAGTLTAVSANTGAGNNGATLSVTVGEPTIAIGHQDTVSGTLQANGTASGHRRVGLFRYSTKLNRWRLVRVKETDANGGVQFTVRPLETARYELGYRGGAKLGAVRSGAVTITVTPTGKLATTLSIAASSAAVQAGGTTRITGALTTVDATPVPGRPVILTRYNPATKKWVRVAVKRSGPKGVVFFVRAPSTTTTFQLVFPGGPRFAGSHSATVTVTSPASPAAPPRQRAPALRRPRPAPRHPWHDPPSAALTQGGFAWPVSRWSALAGQAT